MKITFLSLLAAFAIGLMGCKPEVDQKKVEKIEHLQSRLDSLSDDISAIDSAKSHKSAKHYFENINYIKSDFDDTISNDLAFYIDDYYSVRKAFQLLQSSYSRSMHELRTTQVRLEDLKHDLKAGLIEDQQFQQYYELESNNVDLIEKSISPLADAIPRVQSKYDEMNPRIDSIINASKEKMKNTTSE